MAGQTLSGRYWLTDKAVEALDGRPPIHVTQDQLHALVGDLVEMDAEGAIDLTCWPAAAALVDAVFPVRDVVDVPTGGLV